MSQDLKDMISQCNRCGFCQDVCPTYENSKNEFDVARGRIRMMRMVQEEQYDLFAEKAVLDQVDQCLLCGACVENCPSNVPTDVIMRLTRQTILKKKGFSLFHSLLYRGMLTRQARLEKISGLVRILDKAKIRTQVAKKAAHTALDFLSHAATSLPDHLEQPARQVLSKAVQTGTRADICYFLGCGTNVFTPKAAFATIKNLEDLGFLVEIPQVSCCGGPHFSAGDIQKARTLARHNIGVLSAKNYDVIVSDCATCTHTLHDYALFFPKNDPIQAAIKKLTTKIVDINTFVLDRAQNKILAPSPPKDKIVVTYHDPCHAVRGMGVKQAPRDILKALPGIELIEMQGADSCCGGAGSYSFRHPGMSKKILDRKIESICKTGASMVATSCPSCILQLGAGLGRKNLDIKVIHTMELLSKYGS